MAMYKMTPDEMQLIKAAIGLLETDSKSFVQNLRQGGQMTPEEAQKLFGRALNAKVIQVDRGRLRMAPPPPDPRALSASEILELEQAGYDVHMLYDSDPPLYAWLHGKSGLSQSQLKGRQPFRRTKEQAWVDCSNFARAVVPSAAEPDWKN